MNMTTTNKLPLAAGERDIDKYGVLSNLWSRDEHGNAVRYTKHHTYTNTRLTMPDALALSVAIHFCKGPLKQTFAMDSPEYRQVRDYLLHRDGDQLHANISLLAQVMLITNLLPTPWQAGVVELLTRADIAKLIYQALTQQHGWYVVHDQLTQVNQQLTKINQQLRNVRFNGKSELAIGYGNSLALGMLLAHIFNLYDTQTTDVQRLHAYHVPSKRDLNQDDLQNLRAFLTSVDGFKHISAILATAGADVFDRRDDRQFRKNH